MNHFQISNQVIFKIG